MRPIFSLLLVASLGLTQASCKSWSLFKKDDIAAAYAETPDVAPKGVVRSGIAITLRDQKLTYFYGGKLVKEYSISSSKFGIGNTYGSCKTPTGIHVVCSKVGEGQPKGMVFKSCRPTGEIVAVNAAGRDPIVTRVIQLTGIEKKNSLTYRRHIYLHGTPEERTIGTPSSYGCIRMRSDDILELYPLVQRGTPVVIESCSQPVYKAAVALTMQPSKPKAKPSIPSETAPVAAQEVSVVRKNES